MIKIDFENTFDIVEASEDLSYIVFYSFSKNGEKILLKAKISYLNDPLLPNVYNLAFGPIDENGDIDDFAKVNHADVNKMFSTLLFYCLVFLEKNPNAIIGIDGSNDVRAYLYHRMILTNRKYLFDYFVTIGVDWYVRLLRSGDVEVDNNGFPYFKPKPEPFDYQRNAKDLYRYYMFHKIME